MSTQTIIEHPDVLTDWANPAGEPYCASARVGEDEAARLLGLRKMDLQRYRMEGMLPYRRFGGEKGRTIVYVVADLMAFDEAHAVEATKDPAEIKPKRSFTPEQRERISQGRKAAWDRKKAAESGKPAAARRAQRAK